MEEKILEVLADIRPDCDFESSNDFISDALLDSFDIISLVSELEDLFQISIEAEDIVPDSFVCLSAVQNLVSKYQV